MRHIERVQGKNKSPRRNDAYDDDTENNENIYEQNDIIRAVKLEASAFEVTWPSGFFWLASLICAEFQMSIAA